MLPANAHPLSIPIRSTSLTGAGKYINLPMRPGDVIVVPGGGNVMVVGWVQTPGYFQVGSGLTVLGAIGAAGGPMYAANTKDNADAQKINDLYFSFMDETRANKLELTPIQAELDAIAGVVERKLERRRIGRWRRLSPWRKGVAIGGFTAGTFGLGFTLGGLVFARRRPR